MNVLIIVLGILMVAASIAVLFQRSLKSAALITGIVSLAAAFMFVLMKAYDVAITEASIGAVLSTALYFFAIRRLEEQGMGDKMKDRNQSLINLFTLVLLIAASVLVYRGLTDPGAGLKLNSMPAAKRISRKYISKSVNVNTNEQAVPGKAAVFGKAGLEEGSANTVAAIVVNYRAFDTLGEILVLFASAAAVGFLLGGRGKQKIKEPSIILATAVPIINVLIVMLGLYIILNGHLSPGGGFPGGAIVATAVLISAMAFNKIFRPKFYQVMESLAGLGILAIGLLALTYKKPFLTNFLSSGTVGDLISGGTGLILYILVGIKVAVEIAGISAAFLREGEAE